MRSLSVGPRTWARPPARLRPRVLDLMRVQAGAALSAAVGCRKAVALRIGRSVESVNQWCAGSESNPIYRAVVATRACENPEAIIVALKVMAMRAKLTDLTVEELRAELEDIVHRREPVADARAKIAALSRASLDELRAALAAEAELQERAVAICDEIAEREAEGRQ